MPIATHIVKVRGTFDEKIWNEKKLNNYVDNKIKNDIDKSFNTDLELFRIDPGNKIEVWVLIFAFPSEVSMGIIDRWIKNNIKEEGLNVDNFEFRILFDMIDENEEDRRHIHIIDIPTRY